MTRPRLEQLFQCLPAGALDVHPAAADEMPELLADARRAGRVRAVVADRALVADDGRPADGAGRRHLVLTLGAGPLLDQRPDDLGNHVAGLLENHVIADPDVLAPDLVEVVEGCAGDRRAGDLRRGEVGHRRQRPRPPDVRDDVLDDRFDLLRRELVGDRPAGRPADDAEPVLLIEPIHLDHDAVGLVRKLVALVAPGLREGDDRLDVEPGLAIGVDGEAEGVEPVERGRLGGDLRRASLLEELVGPGRQQPVGRNLRVLLAEGAGAGVAGIRIQREAGLFALGVDPGELRFRHEDLATGVEGGGCLEAVRDGLDRPEIGGHVLARRAIAPGGSLDEAAALVA